MVMRNVTLAVLQLVLLAFPAYAILLAMMVESDFAYANKAVPVVVGSFVAQIGAGFIIISMLLLQPQKLAFLVA